MKNDIEDIYSELETFSKEPPKELWDNIEERLHPKKKRRGILFFLGSAAAVLLVFVGYTIFNSLDPNLKPTEEITDIEQHINNDAVDKSENPNTKIVDETLINTNKEDALLEKPNAKEDALNSTIHQNQVTEKTPKKSKVDDIINNTRTDNEKTINNKKEKSKYNQSYAQTRNEKKTDEMSKKDISILNDNTMNTDNNEKESKITSNDSITKAKGNSLLEISEELMALNENGSDSTNASLVDASKWSLEVLGGLSNTNPSQSSIQGTSVNTTSKNDFIYSFKVGYAISDRLVLKSGIGKNILGQEVNNISYVSLDTSLSVDNFQSIVSNESIVFLASQETVNDFSTSGQVTNEGTLRQRFDYIQVPLEVSYNVLKAQKIDVSIGLGGNINVLTNNRAFLDNENIGESLGVDSTIFGGTLNSNISYELAKKTILFLEPSYNYFEKPIDNNNQAFSNRQFRIQFGLRYKF